MYIYSKSFSFIYIYINEKEDYKILIEYWLAEISKFEIEQAFLRMPKISKKCPIRLK